MTQACKGVFKGDFPDESTVLGRIASCELPNARARAAGLAGSKRRHFAGVERQRGQGSWGVASGSHDCSSQPGLALLEELCCCLKWICYGAALTGVHDADIHSFNLLTSCSPVHQTGASNRHPSCTATFVGGKGGVNEG